DTPPRTRPARRAAPSMCHRRRAPSYSPERWSVFAISGAVSSGISSFWRVGGRMKQLLAIDLVVANCSLTFGRGQPADSAARRFLLGFWVFLRVEQDHIIAVQQARITLDEHRKVALVAETQPGSAIGEGVRAHRCGRVERRPHAAANIPVP